MTFHAKTVHMVWSSHLNVSLVIRLLAKKGDLDKHIETLHEKVKSYKCESCEKSFSQKGHLQRHLKTVSRKY